MGKQNIVYVMQYVDAEGNIGIPYKKIGITSDANLKNRVRDIGDGTKSPIKAEYVCAWSHNEAQRIENTLHAVLDSIEKHKKYREWFLDKDDEVVDTIKPIMELVYAKEVNVENHDKTMISRRDKRNKILLKEIKDLLHPSLQNLKGKIKPKEGPTIFGKQFTFSVNYRSSGFHALYFYIGKNNLFEPLKDFLYKKDIMCTKSGEEYAVVLRQPVQKIADIINYTEAEFKAYLEKAPKSETTPTKQ